MTIHPLRIASCSTNQSLFHINITCTVPPIHIVSWQAILSAHNFFDCDQLLVPQKLSPRAPGTMTILKTSFCFCIMFQSLDHGHDIPTQVHWHQLYRGELFLHPPPGLSQSGLKWKIEYWEWKKIRPSKFNAFDTSCGFLLRLGNSRKCIAGAALKTILIFLTYGCLVILALGCKIKKYEAQRVLILFLLLSSLLFV